MAIRMIALDLDGTTLNSQSQLTIETTEALSNAIEADIQVVISTGRPLSAIPHALLEVPGLQYAITSNGSSIFDLHTGERIHGVNIHPETAAYLLDMIESTEFTFEVFVRGVGFCDSRYYNDPESFGMPASIRSYLQTARIPTDDLMTFARRNINEIEGLNFLIPDPVAKEAMRARIRQIPDIYMTASNSFYTEISHGSVSKASAIAHLAQMNGITPNQIMAFGDADNDKEMLSYAGMGVAMGNSSDFLKKIANDVTLSNDEHGVAHYINRYLEALESEQDI